MRLRALKQLSHLVQLVSQTPHLEFEVLNPPVDLCSLLGVKQLAFPNPMCEFILDSRILWHFKENAGFPSRATSAKKNKYHYSIHLLHIHVAVGVNRSTYLEHGLFPSHLTCTTIRLSRQFFKYLLFHLELASSNLRLSARTASFLGLCQFHKSCRISEQVRF